MSRFWKIPAVAAIALGTLLISAPAASAMPYRGFRGGFYGRGFYGGGWGWGGLGWGWGPGWYGGWWGPGFYYGPGPGKVKIVTPDKDASVFVDGGYVGLAAKAKKLDLRPGSHDLELRDPAGHVIFHQRVEVVRGHTTEIHAG